MLKYKIPQIVTLTLFNECPNLDKQKNDRFHQRKRSLLTLKNKIVLLSQGE
mgnify:CR=1 FL=1